MTGVALLLTKRQFIHMNRTTEGREEIALISLGQFFPQFFQLEILTASALLQRFTAVPSEDYCKLNTVDSADCLAN